MLEDGADVDAVDAEKRSALYIAAENGHADVVKVLCQYGADVDTGNTEETSSALYIAAEEGHVDVVKLLCQYGADVNAVIKVNTTTQIEELTPLYVVACRGDVDITKVMIENGADVNALVQVEYQDDLYFRVRVLDFSFERKRTSHTHEIRYYRDVTDDNALYGTLRAGHIQVAKLLIQNGADISKTNSLRLSHRRVGTYYARHENSNGMKFLEVVTIMKPTLRPLQDAHFLWNLALVLATKHRVVAFRLFYTICSFITYNGVFVVV